MRRERITKSELEAIRRIYDGGMKVDILAAEIGIAVNTLYRWLNGSRTPGYLVTANVRRFLTAHTLEKPKGPARDSRKGHSEPLATSKRVRQGVSGK
jgi:transposase-like protein